MARKTPEVRPPPRKRGRPRKIVETPVVEPRKPRRVFYNTAPKVLLPNASPEEVRAEFGRRLQYYMVKKGWIQSELARQAALYTEDGYFGRDNVSNYINGHNLPGPVLLNALAKALDVATTDLLPTHMVASTDEQMPSLDVSNVGDGTAWLRINQRIPWPLALKVMELLNSQSSK
jgi:transcriptional regulator with XRE-family HTH domain